MARVLTEGGAALLEGAVDVEAAAAVEAAPVELEATIVDVGEWYVSVSGRYAGLRGVSG